MFSVVGILRAQRAARVAKKPGDMMLNKRERKKRLPKSFYLFF